MQDLIFAGMQRRALTHGRLKPGLALGLLNKQLFYGRAMTETIYFNLHNAWSF